MKKPLKVWIFLLIGSILLQFTEGYWQYSKGISNCGTQLKLSAILTGCFFMIIAYKFINSSKGYNNKTLKLLGDNSFAIYFSHIAVMMFLSLLPFYNKVIVYPFNAVIVIIVNLAFIYIGKKVLSNYGKYLAL